MDREQFTFYASFFRAVSRIKNKSARCDAYDAICAYALTGHAPDLEKMADAAAIAFEVARPNLDASRRKSEAGKTGGRPKQSESKDKAKQKQSESKAKAMGNHKQDKEQDKEQDKDKEQMLYSPLTPQGGERKRFSPPTVNDVAEYCRERGNSVDPEKFVDFYAAKGWKVGNQPMKDWKAAVRMWERRDGEEKQGAKSSTKQEQLERYMRW